MKLTMSSEMGIHAAWFLAMEGSVSPMLSTTLASRIQVSETYLIKVLKRLVEARLLESRKGKSGGYRLKKPAANITLADIVRACEGDDDLYQCLHDERKCLNTRVTCPVCVTVLRAEHAMYDELARTTVQDLLDFCTVRGVPVPPRASQAGS